MPNIGQIKVGGQLYNIIIPEGLTEEEQAQIRANIGAVAVGSNVVSNGTYPEMTVGAATKATKDSEGNNIADQFALINQKIEDESHFRGVFTSVEALKSAYPTATANDYAYITGGNIWVYEDNEWTDSEQPVPDSLVPASTSLPLMDGEGSAGSSNDYARGDHVHPSDNTKLSLMDWLNIEYPVGGKRLYIQFPGDITPAEKYPNTLWTIDTSMQGRTIIGSGGNYSLGATGGEATHTLTVDEIPSHDHKQQSNYNSTSGVWHIFNVVEGSNNNIYNMYTPTTATGGGKSHNNMQPYAVVNFWKRTA